MLKLVYFASIREQLGCDEEQFEVSSGLERVGDLVAKLSARGAPWDKVFSGTNVLVAVNQEMSQPDTELADGDEVAFFPPVTGG